MDHGRSIRVVGRPHTFGRKMSGLGIDFSEASTPDSPAYHWEAVSRLNRLHKAFGTLLTRSCHHLQDLPNHPSFVYEGTVPRSSRWSESTQQSRATRAASHSDDSSRLSQGTSIASRQSSQPVTDAQYTSSICITKRPSLVEVQAFRNGNLDQRSARGSDDSQNSVGPITPCDEIDDNHIKVGGLYSFGEAPRKAPLPPVSTVEVPKDMTSKLARRPSLTQSMLRTLSGRKKETRPPPPLVVSEVYLRDTAYRSDAFVLSACTANSSDPCYSSQVRSRSYRTSS